MEQILSSTTLASQVEARFEPNLDQIWDQKFSRSMCSWKIFTAGTNFNRALEGGDFTVLIYYLSLHHQGDRGTKTKGKIFMFCLRGSKNIFQKIWANFELQITLASQVEARFGPNLGQKISTSRYSNADNFGLWCLIELKIEI